MQHRRSPPPARSLPTAQSQMARQQQTAKATVLLLPGVTSEDHSSQKPPLAKPVQHKTEDTSSAQPGQGQPVLSNAALKTSRVSCRHRASSMPSLLPAKRKGNGRGTHSTQNILKHRETGTLCSLGNWQSQNKTAGKVHFTARAP